MEFQFYFILFFASTAVVQMHELIMTAVVYNQRFDIVQNHTYNECAHLNKYSDFSSALHGNPINPPLGGILMIWSKHNTPLLLLFINNVKQMRKGRKIGLGKGLRRVYYGGQNI